MAVPKTDIAQEIGRACAEAVRDEPAARRIWVRERPDEIDVYILVPKGTDVETELRLYAADLTLFDRFPDAPVFLQVINPSHYKPFKLNGVIPAGADEIAFRPRSDGGAHPRAPRPSRA